MVESRLFIAVLAAGSSKRFGEENKLLAPFRGKALGEHVCANIPLERAAPGCASVVVSDINHPLRDAWHAAGFGMSHNSEAHLGMGTSVARAFRTMIKAECSMLLIALADMPFVPREHYEALIDASLGTGRTVCSSDGNHRMPPVVFGVDAPAGLLHLTGDQGARAFLQNADAIECPPQWLTDIDTPQALAQLRQKDGQ